MTVRRSAQPEHANDVGKWKAPAFYVGSAMPTIEQRDYFANRAAEIRKLAADALDSDIRSTLESMAASYEKLVEESDRITRFRGNLPKG